MSEVQQQIFLIFQNVVEIFIMFINIYFCNGKRSLHEPVRCVFPDDSGP